FSRRQRQMCIRVFYLDGGLSVVEFFCLVVNVVVLCLGKESVILAYEIYYGFRGFLLSKMISKVVAFRDLLYSFSVCVK
ncbi:hypothetical protein ACVGWR_07930, partial [Enterobacter hormaechei]